MTEIAEIFPVKGIYFGSGFMVLVWLVPYAFGMVLYHFLARHWARAVAWLVFCMAAPSVLLARVFAWGLENDLYRPRTSLMVLTAIVLIGQVILWRLLWSEYRKRGEFRPWRTVANVAFITSFLLAMLSVVALTLETRYRYLEGIRTTQQLANDREHIASVAFTLYPGADLPFGDCMIRTSDVEVASGAEISSGNEGCGEYIGVHFRTSDLPEDVIAFYENEAENEGLTAYRGTSRTSGEPALVVIGKDHAAMYIEKLAGFTFASGSDWMACICWDTPDDFEDRIRLSLDISGP